MSQSPDLAQAAAFVRARGTASEQSRLRVMLAGGRPTMEEETVMLAGQRPDGGWAPFWAADYSAVDATCFRLAQAEQGGIPSEHDAIRRAALFLRARQQADGSWEEDRSVAAAAPPWAAPGDLAARLYLTANSAYWLARLLPQDAAARSGGVVLRVSLDESGACQHFFMPTGLPPGYGIAWENTSQRTACWPLCPVAWMRRPPRAV